MRVPKGILPAGALLPLEEKNGALGLLDAEVSGRCREKVKGGSAGEEGSGQPQVKSHPHSVPELGKNFTSLSLGFLISQVRMTTLPRGLWC